MLLGLMPSFSPSFSFGQPWILSGLALPLALLYWTWARKGGRVALPFDHGVQHRGLVLRSLVGFADMLPVLLAAVAVLLLAGPQRLAAPTTKRSLTNIQFCIDISGSMTGSFGEGTRYDAAMASINDFLDYRTGDAFGLTFFGNNVLHWVPLTSDTSAFRCAPPFLDPKRSARPSWFGGTSIGKALRACRDVLVAREEGDRMIILISDGYSSDLSGGQDDVIAQLLRESGIVMYGIHVADGAVPGQVVNIATNSGGDVFETGDPAGLDTVFKRIDEMAEVKLEKIAGEQIDAFENWCWIALVILALHLLLQFFLRYTPW